MPCRAEIGACGSQLDTREWAQMAELQGLGVPWFVCPIVDQVKTTLRIELLESGALQIVDKVAACTAVHLAAEYTLLQRSRTRLQHSPTVAAQYMTSSRSSTR